MSKINVLDNDTINKIAAGEVIERPKAVVKELVENAIDADATAITIEIQDGGKKLIRVTDDGNGIEKDDIKLAFKRHCTSKIHYADELDMIKTLGFRGEALSSIAAVGKVELITKKKDELLGNRYIIHGGEELGFDEVGVPTGTTFIVRELFYNTPARLSFLKSNNYEAALIGDIIEKMALSHPEISFKLVVNGKLKLSTSGNGNIKDVIYAIYGKDVANALIEINGEFGNIKLNGYIAKPLMSKQNRNFEIYFVNGRFIKNNSINLAIEAGYYGRMIQGKFPFTALYISMNPDMINVNIHPTKLEVRFTNEQEICNFITDTISDTLKNTDITPNIYKDSFNIDKTPNDALNENKQEYIVSNKYEINNKNQDDYKKAYVQPFEKIGRAMEEHIKAENNKVEQINFFDIHKEESIAKIKLIGQVFRTYWLFEIDDTLFIMDQHAAHEKVLFEKYIKEYKDKKIYSQELIVPIKLELTSKERDVLESNYEKFSQFGFDIEHYGNNTFLIRSVPFNLYNLDVEELFHSIFENISENISTDNNDKLYIKIATISCKAAVKGNNKLSESEVIKLMDDLLKLDNPYQCPHGRPTVIRMNRTDLEKSFARIV